MKVLIVDDIIENLDLLEDIFTTYNYSTVRAMNGIEAIEILKKELISLIVSDILMPKMDGFKLCMEVKKMEDHKNIPFIFYTAHYYDQEDKEYALKIGGDRYFVKPVDITILMQSVDELTKKKVGKDKADIEVIQQSVMDQNISFQDYKKLKDQMFELGIANEQLMQKNKELNLSQGRYRSLFENAGDAIFLLESGTGSILDLNQQAEKITGYKREELLGMKIFEAEKIFSEGQYNVKNEISEVIVKHKNGENIIFEVTASILNENNTGILQVIARNVSEQRKLKERLIQTDKLVSLGHLSAGIAHEIRNPLASININLQLLSRAFSEKSQEYEILFSALQGVERIKKIIDTTLDYVRFTKSSEQKEDLNQIILTTMPLVQVSMVKKDIEIKLELMDKIPQIKSDSKQIQQVLINLLTNANEAIKSKGEIMIKTSCDNHDVILSITDTGEGITVENLKHIFEPFYTQKSGGTGLGLSVVKEILDNHNATIEVNSQINKGTTFIIKFPIIG
jgi:PAS domain S-box-containing protein